MKTRQNFSRQWLIALVCGMFVLCSANAYAAEWVNLSGNVYYNGQPLSVMVLANGQYMFTDPADGRYRV